MPSDDDDDSIWAAQRRYQFDTVSQDCPNCGTPLDVLVGVESEEGGEPEFFGRAGCVECETEWHGAIPMEEVEGEQ